MPPTRPARHPPTAPAGGRAATRESRLLAKLAQLAPRSPEGAAAGACPRAGPSRTSPAISRGSPRPVPRRPTPRGVVRPPPAQHRLAPASAALRHRRSLRRLQPHAVAVGAAQARGRAAGAKGGGIRTRSWRRASPSGRCAGKGALTEQQPAQQVGLARGVKARKEVRAAQHGAPQPRHRSRRVRRAARRSRRKCAAARARFGTAAGKRPRPPAAGDGGSALRVKRSARHCSSSTQPESVRARPLSSCAMAHPSSGRSRPTRPGSPGSTARIAAAPAHACAAQQAEQQGLGPGRPGDGRRRASRSPLKRGAVRRARRPGGRRRARRLRRGRLAERLRPSESVRRRRAPRRRHSGRGWSTGRRAG